MRYFSTILQVFFVSLFLIFFPISILANGEGKTDIKAVSASIVSDIEGKSFQLGNTWQEKPVVLVFIRHFG
ncbi:MAG: hypothetical protein HY819_14965 [Acidobacteria bacterium]|nr:hypothetical protein [Acidobacteriota bacterium]